MIDIQSDLIKHIPIKKTPRNKYIENIVSVLEFNHMPALVYRSEIFTV